MKIRDKADAGTRLSGSVGIGEVRSVKATPSATYGDPRPYRDSPMEQKRLMKETESKIMRQLPAIGRAGNR